MIAVFKAFFGLFCICYTNAKKLETPIFGVANPIKVLNPISNTGYYIQFMSTKKCKNGAAKAKSAFAFKKKLLLPIQI